MTAAEAQQVRMALALRPEDLAAEFGVSPGVVTAWETGRVAVPKHIATHLRWRMAGAERAQALAMSGLPECSWIREFDEQPIPSSSKKQIEHLNTLVAHTTTCADCRARDGYIEARFGPMPPAPRRGFAAIVGPIADRIERLPAWARPAATGAALFTAYSLLKLIALLPSIARAPRQGLLTAAAGIALSASLGAVLGFLYGQYRRLRRQTA